MNQSGREELTEEEKLVAEADLLGIRYLSRQSTYQAWRVRRPKALLADLIRQPSARVRSAVISVLPAHPEYVQAIPHALARLQAREQLVLRLFYTAAVLLQQEYGDRLQPFMAARWQYLPDLFSAEFGLPPEGAPRQRRALLGLVHRRRTGVTVNWSGTYDNTARHLIRRWELERQWSR